MFTLSLLLLSGCQTTSQPKMTVITPQTASAEPALKWVKRGNVYHLEHQ